MIDPSNESVQITDDNHLSLTGTETLDADGGSVCPPGADCQKGGELPCSPMIDPSNESVQITDDNHLLLPGAETLDADGGFVCPPGADCQEGSDLPYTFHTTPADPFPCIENQTTESAVLPPQVIVQTERGESSAFAADLGKPNDDGSLTLIGTKHSIAGLEVGDSVHASLQVPGQPTTLTMRAEIESIMRVHDRYFARIDAECAEALRQNFETELVFHSNVVAGEIVGFTQQAGVDFPVFRDGVVGGIGDESRELVTLNTEGGLGSSGAFVCDREGHIVGQVVAYDPRNHVNLMSPAEQIMDDIRDFRAGHNMENQASPVSYGGAVAPAIRRGC
jgi:hypothetical protein